VLANNTYWGKKNGPSPTDFRGEVDYSCWLSDPPLPHLSPFFAGNGGKQPGSATGMSELDSLKLIRLVNRLTIIIRQRPDSALGALKILSTLVGPGSVLSENLVGGWDNYLRTLRTSSSLSLRNLSLALRVNAMVRRRNNAAAISLADSILAQNPNDNLWMSCQLDKLTAHLAQ
jgi:hypothetical protein